MPQPIIPCPIPIESMGGPAPFGLPLGRCLGGTDEVSFNTFDSAVWMRALLAAHLLPHGGVGMPSIVPAHSTVAVADSKPSRARSCPWANTPFQLGCVADTR